jgi:hypothetical protein
MDAQEIADRLYDHQVCSAAQNACRNRHLMNAAAAEIELLAASRAEARAEITRLTAELEAVRTERDALADTLWPFAVYAEAADIDLFLDNHVMKVADPRVFITAADFKRARDILARLAL